MKARQQAAAGFDLVADLRRQLDAQEGLARLAPDAGFPVDADVLRHIADLRRLLDLYGVNLAVAVVLARAIDDALAVIREREPSSRGGMTRAAAYQRRDAMLWAQATRHCPRLLAASDSAAAAWLVQHDRAQGMSCTAVRKALGRFRKLAG